MLYFLYLLWKKWWKCHYKIMEQNYPCMGTYEIYFMENPHYPEQRKSEYGREYSPDF